MTPEAMHGGAIARLRDGDLVELDSINGSIDVLVPEQEWRERTLAPTPVSEDTLGRRLFQVFRGTVSAATQGASVFDVVTTNTGSESQ
jgi:phosphogluconate dehydratase